VEEAGARANQGDLPPSIAPADAALSRQLAFDHAEEIRGCVQAESAPSPPAGAIYVRFSVLEDNRPTGIEIMRNTTGSRALARCIATRLATWVLPARGSRPDEEITSVFTFGADGGHP
jgi:hypothetical protein